MHTSHKANQMDEIARKAPQYDFRCENPATVAALRWFEGVPILNTPPGLFFSELFRAFQSLRTLGRPVLRLGGVAGLNRHRGLGFPRRTCQTTMRPITATIRATRGIRCYATSNMMCSKALSAVMATPQHWDGIATAGFDDSLFGFYCASVAQQMVKRLTGEHSSFLDLGTGTGAVALELAKKYPTSKVIEGLSTLFAA